MNDFASSRKTISDPALATRITSAASQHTYLTIRFLVDPSRVDNAYRAYAYFRWVDDRIDQPENQRSERLAFIQRQQALITAAQNASAPPFAIQPEEQLVFDLLSADPDKNNGLHAYVNNMMSVMAFDAMRRGRLATESELHDYTLALAMAVTEAMHHFIGHNCFAPHDETRYQAVIGAHITHMLRDMLEDITMGYYNIPKEAIEASGINLSDSASPAFRDWVQKQVRVARLCFKNGKEYLARVQNLRCRLAAYAYIHRFEIVLNSIEGEGCVLRSHYPMRQGLDMIGYALWKAISARRLFTQ